MPNTQTINWRDPNWFAWLAIGAFLLTNIGLSLLNLFNKPLNPDEMQHLHISWLIANGDIIYRDFWEHHGPLYGLLNGALVNLTDAEASLRILFWSRFLSLCASGGVMLLIWLIARQLSLSRIGAFLAVAIFSSLIIVQTKGLEMRPDPLQSLFWIWGVYLLIRNQANGSLRQAILAGALFTLSILSNAKAGIGPFFIVVYYLAGKWLCDLKWSDIWRDLSGMFIGACIASAPFVIYFLINEALIDFLYYNFLWNLEVILYWTVGDYQFASSPLMQKSNSAKNLGLFISDQLPFLLLSIAGTLFWLRNLGKRTEQTIRQKYWLFLIAAAGTTWGWTLDMYSQYFLMFLPLLSIVASLALVKIVDLLASINRKGGLVLGGVIAVTAAGVMLFHATSQAYLKENPRLTKQKNFTNRIVAMTEREEPVANIWSLCGGYMFNKHVGYYWSALADISEIIKAMTGEHPHGRGFIDEMEQRQVRYVIGLEKWLTEGMSDEAMDYLRANFEYTDCLWTRKE